jgi:hypothetical protein
MSSNLLLPKRLFEHLLQFLSAPEDLLSLSATCRDHHRAVWNWLNQLKNGSNRLESIRTNAARRTPVYGLSVSSVAYGIFALNFARERYSEQDIRTTQKELQRIRALLDSRSTTQPKFASSRKVARLKLGHRFQTEGRALHGKEFSQHMLFLDGVAIPDSLMERHSEFVLTNQGAPLCNLVQVDHDQATRSTFYRCTYLPLQMTYYTNFSVCVGRSDRQVSTPEESQLDVMFCLIDLWEVRDSFPALREERDRFLVRALDGSWILGMSGIVGRTM